MLRVQHKKDKDKLSSVKILYLSAITDMWTTSWISSTHKIFLIIFMFHMCFGALM